MNKIENLKKDYYDFVKVWYDSHCNVNCDEYMQDLGFKSAKFVKSGKNDFNGYWTMDDDDYAIFLLLWGNLR